MIIITVIIIPVRCTDGDRVIEIDVVADVGRIIDIRVKQDNLDENAKMIQYKII